MNPRSTKKKFSCVRRASGRMTERTAKESSLIQADCYTRPTLWMDCLIRCHHMPTFLVPWGSIALSLRSTETNEWSNWMRLRLSNWLWKFATSIRPSWPTTVVANSGSVCWFPFKVLTLLRFHRKHCGSWKLIPCKLPRKLFPKVA